MAAAKAPPSALAKAFERKVRLSTWALFFEALWPRVWAAIGLVGLFLAVSLAGLWPKLNLIAHQATLAAFALALLGVFVWIVRVRMPDRDAAVRRVERVSGVPHRPASSYEDTLTLNAEDPRTVALWRAHKARLAQTLARLRVGTPAPRTDRRDPFALRVLLLLAVVTLLVGVGDSASDRLRSAFRFSALSKGAEARLDAWITPPAYTGKPPIMLADGGRPHATGEEKPAGALEIPDRSVLVVRGAGAGIGTLTVEVPGEDGSPHKIEGKKTDAAQPNGTAGAPVAGADVAEVKLDLRKSGVLAVYADGTRIGTWTIQVTPDNPPTIALTKEPERSLRGGLKLFYKVEDDYGVVSAEARIKRIRPKADTSTTAWARNKANRGPRLPYERPPSIALRLPKAYPKSAEGQSFQELGDHLWAGMSVELTLVAKDLAGQTGRSKTLEMVLPERQFRKALARAVVEQRRHLVEDPRNRLDVAKALEALTLEPEGFIDDLQVYLGIRSAYWRLVRDDSRAGYRSVMAQLWNVALRIEDGNLTDAERALREAQERLSKAIENGASDEEIQRLMQELRQALAQFLDQLQKQAQDQPPMQGMDRNSQMMTSRDLDQMLKNLENMARSGDKDSAQQMLSQLRDLLDRLQSGRMADQGQGQRMGQMMDEFGQIIGRQQQLLDDTFGQQRGQQGQQGQQGQRGQRGQRGQQGQGGQGQQPGQGQNGEGQGDQMGALGNRQRELRDRLDRLQRGMREFGMNAPGQLNGAGEAMDRAERALRNGDLEGAADEEKNVLEQLRQGAREMAQQMLQQMPSRYGMTGTQNELDPMGRPPQRTDGTDPGVGVKVPDQIDIQRAREILEELRRRIGESTRPPVELEYLERLLKRF